MPFKGEEKQKEFLAKVRQKEEENRAKLLAEKAGFPYLNLAFYLRRYRYHRFGAFLLISFVAGDGYYTCLGTRGSDSGICGIYALGGKAGC